MVTSAGSQRHDKSCVTRSTLATHGRHLRRSYLVSTALRLQARATFGPCREPAPANPSAGYNVWNLTGRSWVQTAGCGTSISVDEADGLVYVTNAQDYIYVSSNDASTWTNIPGAATQIASAPGLVAVVSSTGYAYTSNAGASNGWAYASCGPTAPGSIAFTDIAIDPQRSLWAVGTDYTTFTIVDPLCRLPPGAKSRRRRAATRRLSVSVWLPLGL
jgi:hypothetical protein